MHAILLILAAVTAFLLGHTAASYQQVKRRAELAGHRDEQLNLSVKQVKKYLIKASVCAVIVNGLNVIYNFIL